MPLDEKDMDLLAEMKAARDAIDGPRRGDFVYFKKTGHLERISQDMGKTLQTSPAGSFCIHKSGVASFSGSLNPGTPMLRLKPSAATLAGKFWFFHHGIAGPGRSVDVEIDCRVFVTSADFGGRISGGSQPYNASAMVKDIEQQIKAARFAGEQAIA